MRIKGKGYHVSLPSALEDGWDVNVTRRIFFFLDGWRRSSGEPDGVLQAVVWTPLG